MKDVNKLSDVKTSYRVTNVQHNNKWYTRNIYR